MAVSSVTLHEPADRLREETIERHRAVVSLIEELEAMDWYDQRIDATENDELRAILVHNRDEEKEHATMLLEWVRRRDPVLDAKLHEYLFTERPVTEIEDEKSAEGTITSQPAVNASLGIGTLRGGK